VYFTASFSADEVHADQLLKLLLHELCNAAGRPSYTVSLGRLLSLQWRLVPNDLDTTASFRLQVNSPCCSTFVDIDKILSARNCYFVIIWWR